MLVIGQDHQRPAAIAKPEASCAGIMPQRDRRDFKSRKAEFVTRRKAQEAKLAGSLRQADGEERLGKQRR